MTWLRRWWANHFNDRVPIHHVPLPNALFRAGADRGGVQLVADYDETIKRRGTPLRAATPDEPQLFLASDADGFDGKQ